MKQTGALVITAMGACTCLGGITTAAAAARAGLASARALADAPYIDEETNDIALLVGYPISGVTDGFEGLGRLCRMGIAALHDLLASAAWLDPRRTALFVVLPSFVEPDEPVDEVEGDEAPPPPRYLTTEAARSIAARIASNAGLELGPDAVRVYAEGRRGSPRSLQEAMDWLRRGRCDYAIVGACDGELDPYRIARAFDAGRLKTVNNPVGFMPGEAGAFILLERHDGSRNQGRAPVALLSGPHVASDEGGLSSGKPPTGKELSQVLVAALAEHGATRAQRGDVYVDLSGEPSHSVDWGNALTRARAACAVGDWTQHFPAASFGDTGATAPILAVCLAARAFSRGYASGQSAVVLLTCDDGTRAAISLNDPRSTVASEH